MTDERIDLKDFIRNLINSLPKDRDRNKPIICLEFKGRYAYEFSSRIVIYRVESLRVLWYRFVNDSLNPPTKFLKEWVIEDGYWKVVNISPPQSAFSAVTKGGHSSLPIIQVEHYNG